MPEAASQGGALDAGGRLLLLGPGEWVDSGRAPASVRRSRCPAGAEAAAIATSPITPKVRTVASPAMVGRILAAPSERGRAVAVTPAWRRRAQPGGSSDKVRAAGRPDRATDGRRSETAPGPRLGCSGTASVARNAARIRRPIDVIRAGRPGAFGTRRTPAAAKRLGVEAYEDAASAGCLTNGCECSEGVADDPSDTGGDAAGGDTAGGDAAGGDAALAPEVRSAPRSHGRSQSGRPVSRRSAHIPIESSTIRGSIARPAVSRGTNRARIARKPRTTNAPTMSSTSDGHPGQWAGQTRRPRRS